MYMHFVHVQDEAELRLLSGDRRDGPKVPRRGRASKIQINVVNACVDGIDFQVPTELEALGNKSAATLCSSFERLVQLFIGSVLPKMPATGGNFTWFIHIMIGDGIATNEAAAKLLLACMRGASDMAKRARYFLILVKCANHQVALTATNAVIGDIGKAAAGTTNAHESVTATSVRLFKYSMTEYYEEFLRSTRKWVLGLPTLPLLSSQPQAARDLQAVYSDRVVPDVLVQHVSNVRNMVGQEAYLCNDLFGFIVDKLYKVDEHPTLSRFLPFGAALTPC